MSTTPTSRRWRSPSPRSTTTRAPVDDALTTTRGHRGRPSGCSRTTRDVDGDDLRRSGVTDPPHGTATVNAESSRHLHAGRELQRPRHLQLHRSSTATAAPRPATSTVDDHRGQRRAERGQRRGHGRRGRLAVRSTFAPTTRTSTAIRSRSRSSAAPIHGTAVLQAGNVLYTPNAELQRLGLLRVHDLRRRRRHRNGDRGA